MVSSSAKLPPAFRLLLRASSFDRQEVQLDYWSPTKMSNSDRAGVHNQHQGRTSSAGGSAAESRKPMPTDANIMPTNIAQQVDSASTRQQSGGDTAGPMWGGSNEGDGADTAGDGALNSDRERAASTRSSSWLENRGDKVESDRGKRPRVEGR